MGALTGRKRSVLALGAMLTVGALAISGCQYANVYNMQLPGGANLGDHPYSVHVKMDNVYDLVPQSSVKLNDVTVGTVDKIGFGTDNGRWVADVTLKVNGDTKLPANTTADIQQTSLLGEKFIELVAPPQAQASGSLVNVAHSSKPYIQQNDTFHHVEPEDVLGALSALLNTGGLQQIQTIAHELNQATGGNETNLRETLSNVNALVTELDGKKDSITKALDGLNTLSKTLNGQKDQIAHVLETLDPGLKVLTQQRGQLVDMLNALNHLSGVAVDTVNKTQSDLIADLKLLEPSLQKLGEAGDNLPNALQLLFTIPFTDFSTDAIHGDYFNLYVNLDLNLQSIIDTLGRSRTNPLSSIPVLSGSLGGGQTQQSAPAPQQQQSSPLPIPGTSNTPNSGGSSGGSSGGLSGLFGTLLGGGA